MQVPAIEFRHESYEEKPVQAIEVSFVSPDRSRE